jgi:hypothetical protein
VTALRAPLLFAVLAAVAAAAGVALVACSAPNHLDGNVYQNGRVAFRVPAVPDGWQRIDVTGADLAFRDDGAAASVLVGGHCNHRDMDAPLSALTQHLIMGTTERDFVSQDTIAFDGREAQHTVMRAKLDGVPMQYDIYVMKKDECVYDLVYVASPDRYAAGAARFEQFATGFHTLGSGGL